VQAGAGDPSQVGLVVGDPGAEATHREAGTHHDGVVQLAGGGEAVVHRGADPAAGDLGTDPLDDLLEPLPVLPRLDGIDVRADEFDAVLVEDARLVQRDRGVEGGLPAEGGEQRVGTLLGDDRLDDVGRDRLDIGGVGELGIRHDRRRVAVDEDDPQALGSEDPAGLGARVVELGRLPDDDRPRPDDEHALDIRPARHQPSPSPSSPTR
jgi:hypothetical protein